MNKTLVVYYSLRGTTRKLGQQIADSLGADIDEIEDVNRRIGILGYLQSALEASAKGVPAITTARDPSDYTMVVVGAPVWAGSIASPMRTYLLQHGSNLPAKVACFCTTASGGYKNALREMAALAHAQGAPTFSIRQADLIQGRRQRKVDDFIRAIKLQLGKLVSAA